MNLLQKVATLASATTLVTTLAVADPVKERRNDVKVITEDIVKVPKFNAWVPTSEDKTWIKEWWKREAQSRQRIKDRKKTDS